MVLASCTSRSDRASKLVIHLPSANELRSKVSTLTVGLDQACFAVNISGSEIPPAKAATSCDLPLSVFSGMAAPGSELSLEVPRGPKRTLEIFAYLRDSTAQPCPTLTNGFSDLDRAKIVRVGRLDSFDVMNDEVTVEVSITTPPAGTSIVTQYSLPATCAITATGSSFVRVTPGIALGTSTSGYQFKLRVTDHAGFSTTAGGYKFKPRWGSGN